MHAFTGSVDLPPPPPPLSCGGNWLANIGPSADGRIPRIYEERLLQIGEYTTVLLWVCLIHPFHPVSLLQVTGSQSTERPYTTQLHGSTRMTPSTLMCGEPPHVSVWRLYHHIIIGPHNVLLLPHRYTYKPASKVVYGIMCQYPDNYTLTIGSVKADMSATKVTLLGYGELKWQYSAPKLTVTMPYLPLDSKLRWGWVLQFEGINPATPKTGLQPQWSDVRPQL